jgi:hypothetical protein
MSRPLRVCARAQELEMLYRWAVENAPHRKSPSRSRRYSRQRCVTCFSLFEQVYESCIHHESLFAQWPGRQLFRRVFHQIIL